MAERRQCIASPLGCEQYRRTVEHGACRSGQYQKPEQGAEDMAIRILEPLLDGELGYLSRADCARVTAAPRREAPPRSDRIARFQRLDDRAEGVAEMAKTDQQVKDEHVPREPQQGTDLIERPVSAGGDEDRRRDREGAGNRAPLPPRAAAAVRGAPRAAAAPPLKRCSSHRA